MSGLCLHPVWINLGRSSATSSRGSSAPLSTSSTPPTRSLPLPPSNPWGWPTVRRPCGPFLLRVTACPSLCLLSPQLPRSSVGPDHSPPGCVGPRRRLPEIGLSLHCLLPRGGAGPTPSWAVRVVALEGCMGRWRGHPITSVWVLRSGAQSPARTDLCLPQALITTSCATLCCRGKWCALRTSPRGRSSCPAAPR